MPCVGEKRNACSVLVVKYEGNIQWENLYARGKIILKWIINKVVGRM
jgi:hypothetical protein